MADRHKAKVEQDANRAVTWLLGQRTTFEEQGIDEAHLAAALGITENEVREAVDYLENHEDVVRWPQAGSPRPSFILKPGRGWASLAKKAVAVG